MEKGERNREREEARERYYVCVMRRACGKMEVVRDGKIPERREKHRIRRREHEEYRRREGRLKGAKRREEKLERMFWHYLRREGLGEIELPRVSYIGRREIEKHYRNMYGEE